MLRNPKLLLRGALIILLAAASPAFAGGRASPAGPEWYVDDNGLWRSIREDWPNLQAVKEKHPLSHRHRRARKRKCAMRARD
jgi:hypothetical protein